jgi:hypothetical protein
VEGLDKGVGGIDSKWAGPGSQRAFCITRGPVDAQFTSNPDQVIQSLSGAEPGLQDAFKNGQTTYTKTTINGIDFLDYDLSGTASHYMVRVGVQWDRLFAFFVTAPESSFAANKDTLQRTLTSFELYQQA